MNWQQIAITHGFDSIDRFLNNRLNILGWTIGELSANIGCTEEDIIELQNTLYTIPDFEIEPSHDATVDGGPCLICGENKGINRYWCRACHSRLTEDGEADDAVWKYNKAKSRTSLITIYADDMDGMKRIF